MIKAERGNALDPYHKHSRKALFEFNAVSKKKVTPRGLKQLSISARVANDVKNEYWVRGRPLSTVMLSCMFHNRRALVHDYSCPLMHQFLPSNNGTYLVCQTPAAVSIPATGRPLQFRAILCTFCKLHL